MTTLPGFLLARYDELEGDTNYLLNVGVAGPQFGTINEALGSVTTYVLADMAAKRRIVVELHTRYEGQEPKWECCNLCSAGGEYPGMPWAGWPCETLRTLALPFSDHPDWREEWRP